MRELEAKDFLAQKTAEQAALENIPLSDLEKRMMYFTESGEMREDALQLNEAFEAEYHNDEYEGKISKLMHHAYKRIKKESPELAGKWNAAIQTLRKGDHYILALWDQGPQERPPYDQLKLLGTALLVIIVGGILIYAFTLISDHYGLRGPDANSHKLMPAWMKYSFWSIMIVAYLYFVVFQTALKRPSMLIGKALLRMIFRTPKRKF